MADKLKTAILANLAKAIKEEKTKLRYKDKEIEKDESVQDDTEWVNDYHNLKGFIEGLEAAVSYVKGTK